MTLDRSGIVDSAFKLLRDHGLGALSMRRLATELGVAPGAIYWHVPSKQDLLAEVAERIVAVLPPVGPPAVGGAARLTDEAVAVADALRAALLAVRDGADVVSLALALRPDGLRPVRDIALLFADRLPPQRAEWAARTLVHFVLGTVAEEQNRAELRRAGHLGPATAGRPAGTGADLRAPTSTARGPGGRLVTDPDDGSAAFGFGVRAIVVGITADRAG